MYESNVTSAFQTFGDFLFPSSYLMLFIVLSVPIVYIMFNMMVGKRVRMSQLIIMMIMSMIFILVSKGFNSTPTISDGSNNLRPYEYYIDETDVKEPVEEIISNQIYEYNETDYILDHDIFSDEDMFEMGEI